MLKHEQLTEQMKSLAAATEAGKKELEQLQQRFAQVQKTLQDTEAKFGLIVSLIQESARSEEFAAAAPAAPDSDGQ